MKKEFLQKVIPVLSLLLALVCAACSGKESGNPKKLLLSLNFDEGSGNQVMDGAGQAQPAEVKYLFTNAAANRIIIPVQAEYLPVKGLEQLFSTVNKVKRQANPKLQIDGILLTIRCNVGDYGRGKEKRFRQPSASVRPGGSG